VTSNRYDLNTAVSYVVTADEGFDEASHVELIKPLRDRIVLNRDGILKCYVGQYFIKVEFVSDVIDWTEVRQIVEEAIEWATTNIVGIFPLRGEKTPAIVKKQTPKRKTNKASVLARCKTNAIPFYPSKTDRNQYDTVREALEVYPLARALTSLVGINGYKIGSDGARLDFNTDFVDTETVKAHMERVFKAAKRPALIRLYWAFASTVTFGRVSRRDYFPFITSTRDLEIEFEVTIDEE